MVSQQLEIVRQEVARFRDLLIDGIESASGLSEEDKADILDTVNDCNAFLLLLVVKPD